jgi:hypothetical protein
MSQIIFIRGTTNVKGTPFMAERVWFKKAFGLRFQYQIINDLYVRFHLEQSEIQGERRFVPDYLYGKQITTVVGINYSY